MIYVLYGENEIEIDKFIKTLKEKENIEESITYNYKDTTIKDVLEEASYKDLFGNKKLVILSDATFLTGKTTLEDESFTNFINNPKDALLVLKVLSEKLDERKKIVKLLKEKATIKEFKPLDYKNITTYIKEYFNKEGYKIDNDAINEIKTRLEGNTLVIDSEFQKLLIYKLEDKNITKEDVKNVITVYEKDIIFKLVEAVTKKDKKTIFETYKKLKEEKEEESVIISLLANQFQLMLSAKILYNEGLDKYKIASSLKEHPYRTELALNAASNISLKEIKDIIYKLALTDIDIKTGEKDKTVALETFLLEL